jgi:hypothetical protein
VVASFDELTRRAAEAKGKIVLFDFPMASDRPPFQAYDEAVQYRGERRNCRRPESVPERC